MKHKGIMQTILSMVLLSPALAFAHAEADGSGFIAGLLHPVTGFDHLLAMLSVGILSAQLGGRKIWTVPTLFVTSMVVGGFMGAYGVSLPYVEFGIALSVVVLGLAIALAHRHDGSSIVYLFVAFFGMLHGHAHGVEMPNSASPVFYSFGFVVSTSCIHILGVLIGYYFTHYEKLREALTYIGAGMTGAGCIIFYGLIGG